MLCKSWLQEETIFIAAPITVKMPRRYAFRFVRITVSATPKTVVLKDFCALSVTSADEKNVIPLVAGVFMYCTAKVMKLADYPGAGEKFQKYKCLYDKLKKSAISCLYDEKSGVFANKYDDFQLSAAGNIWLILGGAADGAAAKNILRKCLSDEKFLKPVSPYMHHYAAEAMCKLNMLDDAKKYIKNYWGSMINDGADTFWEVYKKGDKYLSPYGNAVINSFSHAWSCTPAYFIRKYFNK